MKFPKLLRAKRIRANDVFFSLPQGKIRVTHAEAISESFTRLIGLRETDSVIVRMTVLSKRRMIVIQEAVHARSTRLDPAPGPSPVPLSGVRGRSVPVRFVIPPVSVLRGDGGVRVVSRFPGGGPAPTAALRLGFGDRAVSAPTDVPAWSDVVSGVRGGDHPPMEWAGSLPRVPAPTPQGRGGTQGAVPAQPSRSGSGATLGEGRVVPGLRPPVPGEQGQAVHEDRSAGVTVEGLLRSLHSVSSW